MKTQFLIFALLLLVVQTKATDTLLIDGVTAGLGKSRNNVSIYRLGLKNDFKKILFDNTLGSLSGYFEASFNYWLHDDGDIYGAAFSPVFVFYFGEQVDGLQPYLEAGVGAAYISATKINHRNLTTQFLFEDRIGFGLRAKRVDLSWRYMHYSNGYIKAPNDGIDIWMLSLGLYF